MATPQFAHPDLKDPEYYVPGLPVDYVAQRYGITPADVAKLGSAENPYGTSPKAKAAVIDALDRMHNYPTWTAEPLREKLAAKYGYEPNNFVCGSGETEIISLVLRAFAAMGDKILMPGPCFPMYHLFAEADGRVPELAHQATDRLTMSVDIDAYIDAITPEHKIVFFTNPHSPSGTWTTEDDVRRVVEAAPHALVVLDEAYVHYSGGPGYIHLAKEYDNLAVLRTFSKAFGLAGLRLGFGVAQPEIINALLAVKPTWNIGQLQIAGGVAALDDDDFVQKTVDTIIDSRGYVETLFADKLDRFRYVPGSMSNFFLIEIMDPDIDSNLVFEGLLERGVIVKDGSISFRGLEKRFMRSDVNFRERMDQLVAALADLP